MGRNTAIKRYDATSGTVAADLFSSKDGRLPVVIELLRSPWIFTGADLRNGREAGLGKVREEIVAVAWDARRRCPAAFEWSARTYRIDAIVQVWAVERYWWDPRRRISTRVWRTLARGGTYDLAYDRIQRVWRLVAVGD
ncbi:MAG: hypothetical protein U1E29_13095 [Coriobacteriia bacterium]|nr:hypothetical protein [Coriobacteriia bacterium]